MDREPLDAQSFFKVMTHDFRKMLLIPETFCALLKRQIEISDEAFLLTPKGQWPVRFHKGNDGMFYFVQGWGDFVNHHELEEGDFAIFEHKGDKIFDVCLFDDTACEKEYRQSDCEQFTSSTMLIDTRNITLKHQDPLAAAEAYTSNNPHFIVKMSPWHTNTYMTIPAGFARATGLTKSGRGIINCTLRIPSGKEWPATINTRIHEGRPRLTLTRGWSDFYASNKLKEGDVCIFELNAGMVLNVVIFAKSN